MGSHVLGFSTHSSFVAPTILTVSGTHDDDDDRIFLFNKQNEAGLHKRIHVKTGVIVRFRIFPYIRNIHSVNIFFSPAQFLFLNLSGALIKVQNTIQNYVYLLLP